ncbi:MAG: hypothetical protein RLZZ67_665 [Candidatus Parcubacteria bacterium]|jgi:hypothetical protein
MALELSLFTVSFVAMITIIAHKHIESSRGVRMSVESVRSKTDPILHNVRHTTSKFISYLTLRNGVLLANYIFVHVVRFLMHFSHKVHKVSSEVVSKASQKKENLTRGGTASFYLKKIKEEKEAAGEGEITETFDKN